MGSKIIDILHAEKAVLERKTQKAERTVSRAVLDNTVAALLGGDKSLRRWHIWRFRQLKATWGKERETLQAQVVKLTEALESARDELGVCIDCGEEPPFGDTVCCTTCLEIRQQALKPKEPT